jgi:hypothetical protein
VPYLYDGLPDRPEWLRSLVLKRNARRGTRRDARAMRRGESLIGPKYRRRLERHRRWYARRRRFVGVLTDPSITFVMQLIGAPLVAVQLDRLTRDDGSGSIALIFLGGALVALSVWFSRTREAVIQESRENNESAWLEDRFSTIIEEVRSAVDDAEAARHAAHRELLDELGAIRSSLP